MSAERCEFTDLIKAECAHCASDGKPERRHLVPGWGSPRFEARYKGRCAGCGEPYDIGAMIEYDPASSGWVAQCCAMDGSVDW